MSNVQMFLLNNAGEIITLLLAFIGLFGAIVSKKKQQIYADLYGFISDAEQLVGKTGLDKFNEVFDLAYNKLPFIFRMFISEDDVKRGIESSLNKLEAFAKQQEPQNASTQATSNDAALNTNNTTPVDQASQTAQETSGLSNPNTLTADDVANLASIAQKLQSTVNTAQ